jgi:hypothetical protein
MTGRELIAHMRESVLDDVAVPYLWLDSELLRSLNFAEVQACRRANLIIDGTTGNDSGTAGTAGTLGQRPLCSLSIVANQATYLLSPKILQIKRCQLKSMTYPVTGPVSYPQLDEQMSGWIGTSGTVGTAGSGGYPTYFINEPGNTITFVRAPSSSDTAALVVSRLPLIPFTLNTSPEIDEKWHEGLINWAAHLAFSKPDSDTLNLNLAAEYEKKFTREFGPAVDAYSERMRKVLSQKTRMRPRVFGS